MPTEKPNIHISDGFNAARTVARNDNRVAAVVSKMIPDNRTTPMRDGHGNRKSLVPQSYNFSDKLRRRARRNNDARTQLKLLPDIELAVQILISSILSPSDMVSTELNYVGSSDVFSSELTSSLIERLKQYFEQDYKIKDELPKMLRAIIAEEGSYPVAVIPENVIDSVINGDISFAMEAMRGLLDSDGMPKSIGILGHSRPSEKRKIRGVSLEHYKPFSAPERIDSAILFATDAEGTKFDRVEDTFVSDNLSVLKLSALNKVMKSQYTRTAMARGMGSFAFESENLQLAEDLKKKKISDLQVEIAINRPRPFVSEQLHTLKKQNELRRNSVGKPLVMKLPSESVLPVHVPGTPEKHIGYFLILDEEGNPVEASGDDYFYNTSSGALSSSNRSSLGSTLINRVNTNLGLNNGFDAKNLAHLDFASQVYADMVERDLIARVKNGVQSTTVEISNNEEIYRVMMARALSRKFTQILYIPIDYLTYIAFKYDDDGIGKSLLDEGSLINTLRSVVMFADVIASIKNSIGRTKVDFKLDPKEPDPLKTIEFMQDEIVRSRQLDVPLGVTSATDITNFIQRAGFEFTFTDHPGLPGTTFEIQNVQSSYAKPDSDLKDDLKKHSTMLMGLSPETLDNGFSGEFATTVVANNILLSKRVLQLQQAFSPHVSAHIRKVAMFSEELLDDLKTMVDDHIDQIKFQLSYHDEEICSQLEEKDRNRFKRNRALQKFMETFEVALPKPPSVTLENQIASLETYSEGIDKALEVAYIGEEFITEEMGGAEISQKIKSVKAMAKAHFVRKFMAEKGILTELTDLIATNEDGTPQLKLLEEATKHVRSIVRSATNILVEMKTVGDAADKDIQNASGGESTDTPAEEPTDTGDEGGGGDEFGGDEFNAGGFDEPPADDAPPEGEKPTQ